MRALLILYGIWLLGPSLFAQNINLLGFVQPRVSVFSNAAPRYMLSDSVGFEEYQAGLNLTLPLQTQLNLQRDLRASTGRALLANVNFRYRSLATEVAPNVGPVLSFSAGITGMRASFAKGIWVYSVGGGFVEEVQGFDGGSAFFYGAFTKLQIKGLKKINAYGLALVFSRRLVLPLPIIGWVRRYRKRRTLTVLLPLQVRYQHPVGQRGHQLTGNFSLNGINAGFQAEPNPLFSPAPSGDRLRLNHTYFQATLGGRFKLGAQWRLDLDAGVNFGTRLRVREGRENLYLSRGRGTYYGAVGLRYRFKSKGVEQLLDQVGW